MNGAVAERVNERSLGSFSFFVISGDTTRSIIALGYRYNVMSKCFQKKKKEIAVAYYYYHNARIYNK